MLLRETGFTFNGTHSRRDMGLIYAEKDGHIMTPRIRRNAYEIAGVSGTLLLDGETRDTITFRGTLYPAIERGTQGEAQTLLRSVASWLTAGRKQLIFDYEPDRYYMAEISRETEWSLKNWFGGEIGIRFEAQPFAYSTAESTASAATTGANVALELTLATGLPAPVRIAVANTGSAPITGLWVDDEIGFSGMSLTGGQTLEIDMEPPVGARIETVNALPWAFRFAPKTAVDGGNVIVAGFTWGEGARGASVTISARGRW